MASKGLTVKDLLLIPDNFEMVTNPEKGETSQTLADEPTLSHALAVSDHDVKGQAQLAHQGEVKDLGWNESHNNMPHPLVGGLPNEELWILIRRFNKELTRPVPGGLDMNIADEEDFSPDKLRATVERLYMTVIVGLLGAWKQIARLRSWRESRRTTAFCVAYFIAWLLDFIVPLLLTTLIALIVYPPSREILFPPAPLALVSSKTGGVQKPKAGVLGSTDSATGAPENFKGEAVEAEANNFVNSIASVAISSASGKHLQKEPPGVEDEGGTSDHVPDPTAIAVGASGARAAATGKDASPKVDKTKVPMESAMYVDSVKLSRSFVQAEYSDRAPCYLLSRTMLIVKFRWNSMRPAMHGLADLCDTWERFANALSPTRPFPQDLYRLRLAAVVVPLLAASIFITTYIFMKSVTFGIGVGFFGDPIIMSGLRYLNSHYPNWQKMLELRNTLLKGVPTNAQLTITLLRIGESNKAPLPPPPRAEQPAPDHPADVTDEHLRAVGSDYPLNATDEELKEAMAPDPNTAHETAGPDVDAAKQKSHSSKASKFLRGVKASIKGTVETTLGADHVKAKVGSDHSKRRLGVVPGHREDHLSGPVEFKCRNHGKKGHAYIATKATIPCISFSIDKSVASEGVQNKTESDLHPLWSVAIADIKEVKKLGGLGWKAKLVVGWALDREIADGIEIVDKQENHYVLTAMVLRDELFNRIVSMGGQKWEAW